MNSQNIIVCKWYIKVRKKSKRNQQSKKNQNKRGEVKGEKKEQLYAQKNIDQTLKT